MRSNPRVDELEEARRTDAVREQAARIVEALSARDPRGGVDEVLSAASAARVDHLLDLMATVDLEEPFGWLRRKAGPRVGPPTCSIT